MRNLHLQLIVRKSAMHFLSRMISRHVNIKVSGFTEHWHLPLVVYYLRLMQWGYITFYQCSSRDMITEIRLVSMKIMVVKKFEATKFDMSGRMINHNLNGLFMVP